MIVSPAKTAEPIEMPFGIWTLVGPRKHALGEGADWRHLANATEPSMCGGDAACCQITLTSCFVCETVERISLSLSHLRQLTLSADSEHVKATINQLCNLLSPAAPGVFLPVCNVYGVLHVFYSADPGLNYFRRGVGPCRSTYWNIRIPLPRQVLIMHVKWLLLWCVIDVLIMAALCNRGPLYFCPVVTIFMVTLCNRADHYIFILFLSFFLLLFFPRLISAVGDWMFTILRHMVWP